MACFHPKPAWQAKLGGKLSFQWVRNWRAISVPCGTCHGCIKAHAAAWAYRCQLEMQQHTHASFITLTYDDAHLPITLSRRHLQLWLKRVRIRLDPARIRFFAAGEYGERNQRPHYHAILFGLPSVGPHSTSVVEDAWRDGAGRLLGFITLDAVTPARIGYTAGYAAKKVGWRQQMVERTDPETGEVYTWQPPFIQMSRKPGIGAHAKQHVASWRSFAVWDGVKLPVPRYYHNEWRKTATEQDLTELQRERDEYIHSRDLTQPRLDAAEKIALKKQNMAAEKRRL